MWTEVQQALNQSAADVLTSIARLLPGTIALVVAVAIAMLAGTLLATIARRALTGVDFDRRVSPGAWSEWAGWTGVSSPTSLIVRCVWWGMVAFGLLVGIAALDPTLTSQVAIRLVGSAMNVVTALVVLAVGNVVARFLARGVLISLVNMNIEQAGPLSFGVKWLVLIMAGAMALEHLGIGGRIVELAFGILFGGVVLTLALALGLRSKDIVRWTESRHRPDPPSQDGPVDHF